MAGHPRVRRRVLRKQVQGVRVFNVRCCYSTVRTRGLYLKFLWWEFNGSCLANGSVPSCCFSRDSHCLSLIDSDMETASGTSGCSKGSELRGVSELHCQSLAHVQALKCQLGWMFGNLVRWVEFGAVRLLCATLWGETEQLQVLPLACRVGSLGQV